jgi:hypothetical protein
MSMVILADGRVDCPKKKAQPVFAGCAFDPASDYSKDFDQCS